MTGTADLLEPRGWRLARWTIAALVMMTVHGGASYAVLHWSATADEDASGAIVVEIAPEMTALAVEPLDLAPGPRVDEAAAARQSTPQETERVEEDAPTEDLPSPDLDPEVVLEKQKPVEEETEEVEQKQPRPDIQAPEQAVAAPQTTAPPRVEAPVAKKAAAPQAGMSKIATRAILTWQKSVVQHINRHRRYPIAARRHGVEGDVVVRFAMDRSGHVTTASVIRGSGSSLLDKETLAMLKRADPLPRPPPAAAGEYHAFSLPIGFRLQR